MLSKFIQTSNPALRLPVAVVKGASPTSAAKIISPDPVLHPGVARSEKPLRVGLFGAIEAVFGRFARKKPDEPADPDQTDPLLAQKKWSWSEALQSPSAPADFNEARQLLQNIHRDPHACVAFITFELDKTLPAVIKNQLSTIRKILAHAEKQYSVIIKPMGNRFLIIAATPPPDIGAIKRNPSLKNADALINTLALLSREIKLYNAKPETREIFFAAGADTGSALITPSLMPDSYPRDIFGDTINRAARVEEMALADRSIIISEGFSKLLSQLGLVGFADKRGKGLLRGRQGETQKLFSLSGEFLECYFKATPKNVIDFTSDPAKSIPQMTDGFVVVMDLVKSSSLAKTLGDENFTAALLLAQNRARNVFEKYGGATIVDFLGDAIVIRFLPTHHNPALHAAMATREFLENMAALADEGLLPKMRFRCAITHLDRMYVDRSITVHPELVNAIKNEKHARPDLIWMDTKTAQTLLKDTPAQVFQLKALGGGEYLLAGVNTKELLQWELSRHQMPVIHRKKQIQNIVKKFRQAKTLSAFILPNEEEGSAVAHAVQRQIKTEFPGAKSFFSVASIWNPDPVKHILLQLMAEDTPSGHTPDFSDLLRFTRQYFDQKPTAAQLLGIYLGIPLPDKQEEQYWRTDTSRYLSELKILLSGFFSQLANESPLLLHWQFSDHTPNPDAIAFLRDILSQTQNAQRILLLISTERPVAKYFSQNWRDSNLVDLPPLTESEAKEFLTEILNQQGKKNATIPFDQFALLFERSGGSLDSPDEHRADPLLLQQLAQAYLFWDEKKQEWQSELVIQDNLSGTFDALSSLSSQTMNTPLDASLASQSMITGALLTHTPPATQYAATLTELEDILMVRLNRAHEKSKNPFFNEVIETAAILADQGGAFKIHDLHFLINADRHTAIPSYQVLSTLRELEDLRLVRRHLSDRDTFIFTPPPFSQLIRNKRITPERGILLHHHQAKRIQATSQDLFMLAYHLSEACVFAAQTGESAEASGLALEGIIACRRAIQIAQKSHDAALSRHYVNRMLKITELFTDQKTKIIYRLEALNFLCEDLNRTHTNPEEIEFVIESIKTILNSDEAPSLPHVLKLKSLAVVGEFMIRAMDNRNLADWFHQHEPEVRDSQELSMRDKADFYSELGRSFSTTNKTEEAGEYYRTAEKFALQSGDKAVLAVVYFRQAVFFSKNKDDISAKKYSELAIPILQETGDLGNLIRIYILTANLLQRAVLNATQEERRSLFDAAITHYQKAASIAQKLHDREVQIIAQRGLAMVLAELGERERAFEMIKVALVLAQELKHALVTHFTMIQGALVSPDSKTGAAWAEQVLKDVPTHSRYWFDAQFAVVVTQLRIGNHEEAKIHMQLILTTIQSPEHLTAFKTSVYSDFAFNLAEKMGLEFTNTNPNPTLDRNPEYICDVFS